MKRESIYVNSNVKLPVCAPQSQYLTFKAKNLYFGILMTEIVQIVGIEEITPVPEFPKYAKGVILFQEEIVPIIDIRIRINETETKQSKRSCIIIVRIEEINVGIIADSVEWLGTLEEPIDSQESIDGKEPIGAITHSCVTGKAVHSGKEVILIDLDRVLSLE